MADIVVGESNDGVQVGRGWFTHRRTILFVAAIVVVALFITGAWYMHHRSSQSAQTTKVNKTLALAQAAYNRSDYINAINILRGVANQATSASQKAAVYQVQAQAAMAVGKLSDAANYYDLKHQADPSSAKADAYTLGTIYDRLKQKDKALAQYKIALELAKTQHSQYGSDAPAIQASIDALEHQ